MRPTSLPCKDHYTRCESTMIASIGNINVYLHLNVDRLIIEVDPKLWEAINRLTRPVSERRAVAPDSSNNSTKRLRWLFIGSHDSDSH